MLLYSPRAIRSLAESFVPYSILQGVVDHFVEVFPNACLYFSLSNSFQRLDLCINNYIGSKIIRIEENELSLTEIRL